MTEISNPSKSMRRKALRINLTVRAKSFVLFVLLMAALTAPVWAFGEPLGEYVLAVFPLAIIIGFAVVISPLGTLMSAFTFWTGFWVNSCPNCPSVGIDPMTTRYIRCDGCGDEIVEVEPVAGGDGWFSRHAKDEPTRHFCSMECGE